MYLFTTNLGMSPTSGTVVTGAAWCISLEFLFYMVFPFLARFAMEQGPRCLLKLLALMLFFKLAAYTVNENSELMYFSTFVGRFDQFLIGMLAALLYQRHHVRLQAYAIWLLPAAALLVFGNSAAILLVLSYAATWALATWALATLSYSAIEEPSLRMRRNYGTSGVDKGAGQAAPVAVTGGVSRK